MPQSFATADNALANEGFSESDIIKTDGAWPMTVVFINRQRGNLNRELVEYFDIFLPTRTITLHETTGGMRRKKFHYKRGLIGFNPPATEWSIEWTGQLEGVTLIFDADTLNRAAALIYGDDVEHLIWRKALSDNMPAIAFLGLDIASQIGSGYPAGRDIVDQQILTFIGMILRRYASTDIRQTAKVGIRSPQVLRATNYIETNLTDPITTQIICDVAAASVSHLNKLFREELGYSVWNYVILQRMTAAAAEIRGGNRCIEDLAKSYNFRSRTTFSNQFKARFGMPPGQYRKTKAQGLTRQN